MFLVESYIPQLDEEGTAAIAARLGTAVDQLAGEGIVLRWLRSFAVIDDETYLSIVAARDPHSVVLLTERALLAYDHIAEVIAVDLSVTAARSRDDHATDAARRRSPA